MGHFIKCLFKISIYDIDQSGLAPLSKYSIYPTSSVATKVRLIYVW